MTETKTPKAAKGLYARLCLVMADVAHVSKEGYNQHHKYKFVSHDDVAMLCNKALAEHGIAFLPTVEDVRRDGNQTTIKLTMRLICADTGEESASMWFGEANDTQDKGINKALTNAKKTFLLNTFLIASGEEEVDAQDAPTQRRPEPAPAPAIGRNKTAPAPKPQAPAAQAPTSSALSAFFVRMRDAKSVEDLAEIGVDVTNNLELTAEETKRAQAAIAKRVSQLVVSSMGGETVKE
jgi:hypothetical protein